MLCTPLVTLFLSAKTDGDAVVTRKFMQSVLHFASAQLKVVSPGCKIADGSVQSARMLVQSIYVALITRYSSENSCTVGLGEDIDLVAVTYLLQSFAIISQVSNTGATGLEDTVASYISQVVPPLCNLLLSTPTVNTKLQVSCGVGFTKLAQNYQGQFKQLIGSEVMNTVVGASSYTTANNDGRYATSVCNHNE